MKESNFERARTVASGWPEWKRTYVLTADSMRGATSTHASATSQAKPAYKQEQDVNASKEARD